MSEDDPTRLLVSPGPPRCHCSSANNLTACHLLLYPRTPGRAAAAGAVLVSSLRCGCCAVVALLHPIVSYHSGEYLALCSLYFRRQQLVCGRPLPLLLLVVWRMLVVCRQIVVYRMVVGHLVNSSSDSLLSLARRYWLDATSLLPQQ